MVKFKSVLKPEGSIISGAATMIVVGMIYNQNLPSTAIIHATKANDMNVDSARKKAIWEAMGVISAITLITKDVNIFVLGGLTAILFDFHARIANASSPTTGKLVSDEGYTRQLSAVPGGMSA